MAVKIRMTRMGRRHRPFFRINAVDSRTPRDGRILEKLGHYDPIEKDPAKQVVLNLERVKHWLDLGAVPSETVSQILSSRFGFKTKHAEAKKVRREQAKAQARAKGKFFNKAEKVAADKVEETKAAEAKAAEDAKAAAAKAAEEAKAAEAKAAEEKAAADKAAEEAKAEETPAESEPAAKPEEAKAEEAPAEAEAKPEEAKAEEAPADGEAEAEDKS